MAGPLPKLVIEEPAAQPPFSDSGVWTGNGGSMTTSLRVGVPTRRPARSRGKPGPASALALPRQDHGTDAQWAREESGRAPIVTGAGVSQAFAAEAASKSQVRGFPEGEHRQEKGAGLGDCETDSNGRSKDNDCTDEAVRVLCAAGADGADAMAATAPTADPAAAPAGPRRDELQEGPGDAGLTRLSMHSIHVAHNDRGWDFRRLLGPWAGKATSAEIWERYLR